MLFRSVSQSRYAGLKRLIVGLGWDALEKKGYAIDCDASAMMLDSTGKLAELIYFGNKKSKNGSVGYSGDNLTGEGEGDDETIIVDIAKIPENVDKLIFLVNIYDCKNRKQEFGMIQNSYIRILNGDNKVELAKYSLIDNYAGKTALITGEIYRHNGEWKFNAIGQGTMDKSLTELTEKYR